jgi:hypothetical protein
MKEWYLAQGLLCAHLTLLRGSRAVMSIATPSTYYKGTDIAKEPP